MQSFTFPGASGSLATKASDANSISSKLVFLNSCDFWATSLGQLHLQFWVHPQVEMEHSSSFRGQPCSHLLALAYHSAFSLESILYCHCMSSLQIQVLSSSPFFLIFLFFPRYSFLSSGRHRSPTLIGL